MASESDDRYFVTIRSDSTEQLAKVRELGLDLFGATAKPGAEGVTIEGLLSEDDVKRVEAEGAKVDVQEHVSARSRADEQTADLDQWLKDIGA